MLSNATITLSSFHNGKTPFLTVSDAQNRHTVRMDTAADALGVSRQTLGRWVDGSQNAPTAALRLLQVLYLGHMPWDGWEAFRLAERPDQEHRHRWVIVHDEIRQEWPPERLALVAYGYDAADAMRRQMERQAQAYQARIDLLQASVTALSTRQAPPIPCAEIIRLNDYRTGGR